MKLETLLVVALLVSACGVSDSVDGSVRNLQGPSATSSPTVESTRDESFDPFADALVGLAGDSGLPGMAFAVVDRNGVAYADGFGFADVEGQIAATPDTLFHAGSTHKALNALLIATLVDDGALGWNTPITEIVSDFPGGDAMTVRHLLTMTAGISAGVEDDLPWDGLGQEELAPAVFDSIVEEERIDDPGFAFEYSNVSASAAGYAAVLADQPDTVNIHQAYLDVFEDRVLDALGMDDSTLLASVARAGGSLSLSYDFDGEALESSDTDEDLLAPSGSLKSTANDMAAFLQLMLNDGVARGGREIVRAESIATMWEPELENYAMGWELGSDEFGHRYLVHEGAFDGFLSLIMVDPEAGYGLVVLTNSEDTGAAVVSGAPALFLEALDER